MDEGMKTGPGLGRVKLDRAIVFLDLEATGVDPQRDRIVQVALVRLAPDGSRTTLDSYVDPEMPIPPEASAIHHITDDQVRQAPRFRDLAIKILEFVSGCDLGGFGAARYDVPLLTAEFRRAGIHFDLSGRRVVDALTIYHRMEPRNLSAALAFYCGKSLAGAHDARADAVASLEVLLAQVERYRGRSGRPDLPDTVEGLAEFCGMGDPKNVDLRGKFVWRHGVAAFNFGKYQTRALEEIVELDRSYVEWLANGEKTAPDVADVCRRALQGVFPRKPA